MNWSYGLTPVPSFLELLKQFDVVTGVRPVTAAQRGRSLFDQPAGNARGAAALLAVTTAHVLRDPMVYADMKPVLGRWPQAFHPIFDAGRWAVSELWWRR